MPEETRLSIVAKFQPIPASYGRQALLSDAELAEDHVQEVFGGGFADDFAHGVDGDSQVQGDELQGCAGSKGFNGAKRCLAGAVQGVLMAGVDHHFEHFGSNFSRPCQVSDGVLEGFDSLTGKAGDANECGMESGECGGCRVNRQVSLVKDEDALLRGKLGEEA